MTAQEEPQTIKFFSKTEKYFEFSNFYPVHIVIDEVEYNSVEQWYQSEKYNGPNASAVDRVYAQAILSASSPGKVKALGSQKMTRFSKKWQLSATDTRKVNDVIAQGRAAGVKMRPDWDCLFHDAEDATGEPLLGTLATDSVKDVVMRLGLYAKYTQDEKMKKLLLGTGDAILVEDSPFDKYWGTGPKGDGLNMLGKMLMQLRDRLRREDAVKTCLQQDWVP